ncbi:MAG: hypothetical protein PVF50_00055 [Gammaproteobacteria bacterium]|jgi:hypothetical protein
MQHGVGCIAIAATSLPVYVKSCGWVFVVISAICARPRCSTRLGVSGRGAWSLPDESLSDMQMLSGTRYTQWWVSLKLGNSDGLVRSLCIWRDVLAAEDWRQLSIRLREFRHRAA